MVGTSVPINRVVFTAGSLSTRLLCKRPFYFLRETELA